MSGTSSDERRERRSYRSGFLAACALTAVPFLAVWADLLARKQALALIAVLSLLQVIAQFRWFLHIDLSRQKREDLQLILFSTLILILVAGGTVWVMCGLSARMMPDMTHPQGS